MDSPSLSRASTSGEQVGGSSRRGGWRKATNARQVLPNYRTKPCRFYLEGACPRGEDCSYIHGSQPLLFLQHPYPTALYHSSESLNTSPVVEHAILHHSPYATHSVVPMDSGNFFGAPVFTEGRDRQRKSRGGRTCHYRTKPCRFYQDTGRCAKGDRCNFVHDIRPLYTTAETETESSVGALDSASEADTAGSEQHEWQSQSEERARDGGKGERGNYYPITWRVIGGGVMMSGPREICQDYMAGRCHEGVDCKFSHPAAADELEPILISELLPHQYHGSSMLPASPLQLMPVPFFMQAPPRRHPRRNLPRGQDGNVVRSRRKEEAALSGATLRPIEPSQSVQEEADSSMEAPMSPVQSARPSELLEARMIERPLSTPPATSAVAKLIRIFPAESPQ